MVFYKSLFVLSFFINSPHVQTVNILDLEAGDICRRSQGLTDADYVCTHLKKCVYLTDGRTNNHRPSVDICSYDVWEPIVCCPPSTLNGTSIIEPSKRTNTLSYVDKKCHQYSELVHVHEQAPKLGTINRHRGKYLFLITGGTDAKTSEFPHMALLGYGDTEEDREWRCGGSLISERWILTAAHCKYVSLVGLARWARLGDLNIASIADEARPEDYRIIEHVLHPEYEPPAQYNDIALFRLEKDVEFSKFVRPICLNSDPLINPTVQIATGWGQIYTGGPPSEILLKVELNNIPTKQCNSSYFSKNNPKLKSGIIPDMMICAGSIDGGRDTCTGDSGGPLQVQHFDYKNMYLQVGITSFGKFCGDKSSPGVYTRVSRYISWIENIVWPQSEVGNAN